MRKLGFVFVLVGVGVPIVGWCFATKDAIRLYYTVGPLGSIAHINVALPWPQRERVIDSAAELRETPRQELERLRAKFGTSGAIAEPPDTVEHPTTRLEQRVLLRKQGVVKYCWRMGEVKVPYRYVVAGGAAALLVGIGLMVWPSLSFLGKSPPRP